MKELGVSGRSLLELFGATPFRFQGNALSKYRDIPMPERKRQMKSLASVLEISKIILEVLNKCNLP